jgi:hypothetical protein
MGPCAAGSNRRGVGPLYLSFPKIPSGLDSHRKMRIISSLKAMFAILIRPETLVRRHRAGFRGYWHWKSGSRGGRPQIESDLRALIPRMSIENPLWGAPRIRGELLKLGFEIAQSSVGKYMVKRRGPPSQGWRTFVRNHAPDIVSMDLFAVPVTEAFPWDDAPAISHPGSGSGLRHRFHTPTAGHGHKR